MAETKQQICTLRILFPVISDEQAMDCKHRIEEILADIPEAQIDFRIIIGKLPS